MVVLEKMALRTPGDSGTVSKLADALDEMDRDAQLGEGHKKGSCGRGELKQLSHDT